MSSTWSTGLCACTKDMPICFMSCCCPCVQYGKNIEAFKQGSCLVSGVLWLCLNGMGVSWFLSCSSRGEMRGKWGIPGSSFEDCCCHFLCACCAIAQEAREIKERSGNSHSGMGMAQPNLPKHNK